VGYSRLMGVDESDTLARLKAHRKELIDPRIADHGGRIIKLIGDGALVEFASVVDALACAVEIQRGMEERNLDAPLDKRIVFRIGINLGDVIVEGDDIYGDGVNIAARLEALAEPGGIFVSETVHTAVGNKLPLQYEDLGEQQFKNIAEPIRTYRVAAGTQHKPTRKRKLVSRRSLATNLSRVFILLAIAIAAAVWLERREPALETGSSEQVAWELPDKPSIAVLPFQNMSDDREQEYFSDGITEDIITDLSRISGLFVIARNSSFQYKRTPVDIIEIARELSVRYILEGSVRKAGDQVRINAQLIDATTGGHMWANRYDGRLDNIFELQDNVTQKIITALAVRLTAGEKEQVTRKETENTMAYDAFLRGWEHYLRQTPEDFVKAVAHFNKALELDGDYARAYGALAATYWEAWKRFWHKHLGISHGSHEPRFRAEQFLIKAMESPTPLAHQVASAMLLHQQQYEDAIAEAQRAIALDPNDADSYVSLAASLSLAGKAEEALDWVDRAMRRNPHYPAHYLYQHGLAHFVMGEFAQAAISLEKANALNPHDRWSHRLLIATYGSLNRIEDATRVVETIKQRDKRGWLNTMDPMTIRTSAYWLPFKEPADAERLSRGLRNAGIPD
jgi:TolB-like protein/Flp pilus assembly protein TadD